MCKDKQVEEILHSEGQINLEIAMTQWEDTLSMLVNTSNKENHQNYNANQKHQRHWPT